LSLAFAYVFVLITFLGGIYGFHLKDTGQQVAALMYAGSSLGVLFAGDLFTLFVYWETMAVASAYLILARRTEQSRRAGMRYLLVHLFGGSVLLAGILWHFVDAGSISFDRFDHGSAAYLILFGFSLNAAIPPLHAWLADAYPEGTVTGSVFLSAFTTKTAVYVLARGFAGWDILIWAGVIMAIYGVVFAVLENDIRRLLAYHIISQVGYMVAGVGLGTEAAINGATAHAFSHILYKGLLFMGAGTVLYSTNRSKLTELGGLARAMPVGLSLYMVGAFSISGFPLFSGFVSKSLVIHAAELQHEGAVVLLLYLASVGTFLHTGLKLPYFTWFGPQRVLKPLPIPRNMYAGMILAGTMNIAIGVYPGLLYDLMPFPVVYRPYTTSHVMETLQLLAFTGLGFWLLINKLGG
ncbi:MAG: Na(+)/H(+) antiporter subunit D, partial [Candidatus Binatia bacterium]